MKALEQIASYGIDNKSFVVAGSDIHKQGDLGERAYRERITELTVQGTDDIPIELVPVMYGYTVQEAIRTNLNGKELYEYAKQMTTEFFHTHQYIFVVREEEQKIDEQTGEVKKKKGEKGDLAREAYRANLDNGLSRKEMIAAMVEAASMSPAGASTYYAKFKKEYAQ